MPRSGATNELGIDQRRSWPNVVSVVGAWREFATYDTRDTRVS
jgi:hypothetical protein